MGLWISRLLLQTFSLQEKSSELKYAEKEHANIVEGYPHTESRCKIGHLDEKK